MDPKQEIDKEYEKLKGKPNRNDNYDRCQIYKNLITLKREFNLDSYHQTLYVDVKNWIKLTCTDKECYDFGYDTIPLLSIFEEIEQFPRSQQSSLFKYLLHYSKIFDFPTELIEKKLLFNKLNQLKEKKSWFIYVFLYLSSNIKILSLSVVVFFLLCSLIFLPAHYPSWIVFETNLQNYSSNIFCNCIVNCLVWMTGIELENPIIIPTSIIGVFAYISIKIGFIGLLASYVYQKLIDIIENMISDV